MIGKDSLSLKLPKSTPPILDGILMASLLMVTFSIILGLLFYATPLSESWLHPASIIIVILSLFFGGRRTAKKAGKKGLVHGAAIGLIYLLIMFILSITKDISWFAFMEKSVYALIASGIGGIIGVK